MTRIRLKDVVATNRRTLPETTDPALTFRYIDISAVSTGSIAIPADDTRFETAPSRARRLAEPGDVVVSTVRTYLKAVARVPESSHRLVFSTGFAVLHPNRERLDSRYLGYFCESAPFIDSIVARSVGVSYPAINASEVADMPVDLPPLDEQRRIADFLDTETTRLDRLIQSRERQGGLSSERLDALTLETIRGARELGLRRPSNVRWVGDVPASWGVAAVSHKFRVDLGKMLNAERSVGPHPQQYLRNANVQWDRIDTSDLAEMDFPAADHGRYSLRAGDLLVCEGGEPGRAAVWNGAIEPMFYQKALHRVRPISDALPKWLYYCLRAATAQDVFAVEGNLTTIAHLTGEQLRAHRFPFPDRTTQTRLVAELDQETERTRALKQAMEEQVLLLRERRQALITAAVTGQVDVTTSRSA